MKKFFMVVLLALVPFGAFAADDAHDFKYTEVNTFIKHDNVTFGYRFYDNEPKDYKQYIVRYDFKGTPYRVEYRRIDKSTGTENWYRGQMKHFKKDGWFYNSRLEYRDRAGNNKDDIIRYRPQLGYNNKFFAILEPQVTIWSDGKSKNGFSHAQWFIGYEFKLNKNLKVAPQLQLESDSDWKVTKQFATVDLKYSF